MGFPSILIDNPSYHQPKFPYITIANYQGLASTPCCTITREGDTQWAFSSVLNKVFGSHDLEFGGEKRIFLNTFFQPTNTSGEIDFSQGTTEQSVFSPNSLQGNGLASMLLGWADSAQVGARPPVANKSGETAFFVQDNWRITSKLTLNLGLRYEFSTPYSERFNREQFSCFTCDSGINVPSLPAPIFLAATSVARRSWQIRTCGMPIRTTAT